MNKCVPARQLIKTRTSECFAVPTKTPEPRTWTYSTAELTKTTTKTITTQLPKPEPTTAGKLGWLKARVRIKTCQGFKVGAVLSHAARFTVPEWTPETNTVTFFPSTSEESGPEEHASPSGEADVLHDRWNICRCLSSIWILSPTVFCLSDV